MLSDLLVLIMILVKVRCNVCCDDWECNLFNDQGNCSISGYCIWKNGACKEQTCEDLTSTTCASYGCKWDGSACSNVTTCAGWSSAECTGKYQYNSAGAGYACISTGTECKVAACSDFNGQSACDNIRDVGGQYTACYWDSSCKAATGCGSFINNDCDNKYWNDDYCALNDDGSACVVYSFSCSSLQNEDSCTSYGSCKWSGSSCSNVTSCSDYTQLRCDHSYISGNNNADCIWKSNACRTATCSDWDGDSAGCGDYNSGSGSANYGLYACVYSNNKCTAPPECGTFSVGNDCDNAVRGCYWLSSCPVEDDGSASLIYVPALLVALLLFLSL